MSPWAIRLFCSLFACIVSASADTVIFKDGTRVVGTVSRMGEGKLAIHIDEGRMTVRESDVERIVPSPVAPPVETPEPVSRREQNMGQLTGVPEKLREKLEIQLRILGTGSDRERLAARQALVELGKKEKITSFLRVMMKYAPSLVPDLADVLAETDPTIAVSELERLTTSTRAEYRARAITTLMRIDSDSGLRPAAAGLSDDDFDVRMAAATALARAKDRRATAALIESMKSGDRRIRNASRDALTAAWSTSNRRVDFVSPQEWERFWKSRADSVPGALEIVPPETRAEAVEPKRES